MIVLDTNVLSEAMRPSADRAVTVWLDAQVADTIYISAVTLADLLFGLRSLPSGRRKDALATTLAGLLEVFGERILSFDGRAARVYADIAARARLTGRGLPIADGYIAATAALHG